MKLSLFIHVLTLFIPFLFVATSYAEIKTETVAYGDGDAKLEGFLAYDPSLSSPRPGVLIVHEWWGCNDYVKLRARELAALGYTAFALDMYGQGMVTTDPKQALAWASALKGDRAAMRRRAQAGLTAFLAQKPVDKNKIAVIGYCFGGTTALELARSGAALKGAVCFHGSLDTPNPADAKNIRGPVLVMLGADDPNISQKERDDFQQEMRQAKVDWQLVLYGNAVHSFTNPAAGNDNSKGAAYNEKADRRSWLELQLFLKDIFSEETAE